MDDIFKVAVLKEKQARIFILNAALGYSTMTLRSKHLCQPMRKIIKKRDKITNQKKNGFIVERTGFSTVPSDTL